ncbi:hypothetical protein TNCV_2634041 [Trichonephila clavipes]|nr:hypothetical protein TNCV_2634041 [Trichonephila clavipes]
MKTASSPPSRKLSKNQCTNSNPELNFKINLENKFNGLENGELRSEPIAGTSSDTTATNVTQINSNRVIFDFNATHNAWNCSRNSTRGTQLKNFSDIVNLEIAFPNSPTRYGYNSSNTLDFALISNFNFPCNIESISELSSDHNPVICSISPYLTLFIKITLEQLPPVSCLQENIKSNMLLSHFTKINNPLSLEEKIGKFTDTVRSAHQHSSTPIANKTHSYTPQHIKELITRKNRARKLFQRTLNPIHRTEANRFQALVKRELKIHSQNTWNAKLNALETQDNSLWHTQKHFRKNRSNIPNLNCSSGIASNDEEKANLIANTFVDNYTENKRPENFQTNIGSDVTNTQKPRLHGSRHNTGNFEMRMKAGIIPVFFFDPFI